IRRCKIFASSTGSISPTLDLPIYFKMNRPMDALTGKRITVAGLGRFGGGIAVAKWLVQQGAKVLVTDKEPAEKLTDSLKQLDGLPIEYRLGEHRALDFTSADLVVPSPA